MTPVNHIPSANINDQHREKSSIRKITADNCIKIQHIAHCVGRGIDISEQKQQLKASLELVLDGVSLSTSTNRRGEVGVYLLGMLIKDNAHLVEVEDIKTIQSIIEPESPAFRL